MRAVYFPYHASSFAPESRAVWVTRTANTAIARMPSNSGKRGFPGGGATTGSTLTAARAYPWRRAPPARLRGAAGSGRARRAHRPAALRSFVRAQDRAVRRRRDLPRVGADDRERHGLGE